MKLECNIDCTCFLPYSIAEYYNMLLRKHNVFHIFLIERKCGLCRHSVCSFTKI